MKGRSTTAELTITSMAPSGEAVAHHDDAGERRAVLVSGAVPGEKIRARFDLASRPARGELLGVLEPSADRVASPCPFVTECGGCDWMHLSRDAQRREHIRLANAGEAPIAFHAAPLALEYRVRARVHVRGARVGFFGPKTHDLVAVETCVVLDPRIDAARADLGKLFAGSQSEGDVDIAMGHRLPVGEGRFEDELPGNVYGRLEEAVRSRWQGFRVWCGDARRPATFGDPTPWLEGPDGAPLELAPGGFAQAHAGVNAALVRRVVELAADAKRVVELYAGSGNLTVMLARDRDVRAVESSDAACEAARKNLRARGLEARVTCADASTFDLPKPLDLLVLDPPRTGAREVCERIAASRGPRRIIYVSCDRATLTRDLQTLSKYRVASIDLFEMFPQTSHIETVVALDRI